MFKLSLYSCRLVSALRRRPPCTNVGCQASLSVQAHRIETAALTVPAPRPVSTMFFLKLNVFLWALEFHYSRHSCGCGFVAMVLSAYVTNSLFLFHGSLAASGLYFLMLGEHVSDVLATRRRCVAGRDPFILSYGCSPMTLKPWRHGHVQ